MKRYEFVKMQVSKILSQRLRYCSILEPEMEMSVEATME